MNIAEILRAAAARVRQGWMQHSSGNHPWEPVCALGAIKEVAGERTCIKDSMVCHDYSVIIARALALPPIVEPCLDYPKYRVVLWNDADGQTAENVAAGLEYVALLYEQEQAVGAVDPVGEQVTS